MSERQLAAKPEKDVVARREQDVEKADPGVVQQVILKVCDPWKRKQTGAKGTQRQHSAGSTGARRCRDRHREHIVAVRHNSLTPVRRSPISPCGRTRRSAMNAPNTMTSLKDDETYPAAKASIKPMAKPPTSAPGRLPNPPSTAAVTPF